MYNRKIEFCLNENENYISIYLINNNNFEYIYVNYVFSIRKYNSYEYYIMKGKILLLLFIIIYDYYYLL